MANFCYTTYKIFGPERNLKVFIDTLSLFIDEARTSGLFEVNWFARKLGIEIRHGENTRGEFPVDTADLTDGVLSFGCESDWTPCNEVVRRIAAWFGLEMRYMAENFEDDIFVTDDAEGRFFQDLYYIDIEDDDSKYYTEQGFYEKMTTLAGRTITSFEQAREWADQQEDFISIHKAEIAS